MTEQRFATGSNDEHRWPTPTTPLICAACGQTDPPVVEVPLHPRCAEARATPAEALPPCPICGKDDLFMGADGKPGCPHCEVAVTLPRATPAGALTFKRFAQVNRERCEAPDGFGHPLSGWSRSDWFLAATGEFGEAANKAKKLNRVRDGIPGNTETPDELRAGLADEIADAVIYLDLLAQSEGFDLGTIIASKFNRTSEKIGSPARLSPHDEA